MAFVPNVSRGVKRKRDDKVNSSKQKKGKLDTLADFILSSASSQPKSKQKDDSLNESTTSQSPSQSSTPSKERNPIPTPTPTPTPRPQKNFAPQVQIIDGLIVVNEESLYIESQDPNANAHESFETVYETGNDRARFNGYRKNKAERWTQDETDKFYMALRQCGSDFSMIQMLFPKRDRRQIRNKFKREEKENPFMVDEALHNHLPMEINDYNSILARLKEEKAKEREKDGLLPEEPQTTDSPTPSEQPSEILDKEQEEVTGISESGQEQKLTEENAELEDERTDNGLVDDLDEDVLGNDYYM